MSGAAWPAGQGEVIVQHRSGCTWNGAGVVDFINIMSPRAELGLPRKSVHFDYWGSEKKKRKNPKNREVTISSQFPSHIFINGPTSPHLGYVSEKARFSFKEKFLVGRRLEKGNQAPHCSGCKAALQAASLPVGHKEQKEKKNQTNC